MAAGQRPPVLGSLALIAIVIGLSAALFAYTAGWFSPRRLTPDKVVAAFSPPNDTAVAKSAALSPMTMAISASDPSTGGR